VRLLLLILSATALTAAVAPPPGAPKPESAEAAVRLIEAEGDAAKYWPRWRGPSGQGMVRTGRYPDAWSPTEGVKWKVSVPGRGNSSPIVWRDRIFFTTAYDEGAKLSLLCYSRSDGKLLWEVAAPQQEERCGILHACDRR
jgi:hypothetical protein